MATVASWLALPKAELYAASKHAVLGLMRSLDVHFALQDIRISCIHPFFAGQSIRMTLWLRLELRQTRLSYLQL